MALHGLNDDQVAARVRAAATNTLPSGSSRTLWHIVRANLFTLFNAVVGAGTLVLLLFGDWQDGIFGVTALANVLIGVFQEFRAKRLLDSLALLDATPARVLRDGEIREIPTEEVVLDDLLVLRQGDQVPADAIVLSEVGLEIDESLLTGETVPNGKSVRDTVLSGSAVAGGHGTARVVRVGADSYSSRLTVEAKRFSLVNSELRNAADRIVRWVSWGLAPLILLVLNAQMHAAGGWDAALHSGRWREALVGTVASAASVIPQGLILMISIAFALAAAKLARSQVLVQEIAAIEILARVDTICFDKTGTLTDGAIVFDDVHGLADAGGGGGEKGVLGCFGADVDANATARCLGDSFSAGELRPSDSVPFSSERKWSALVIPTGDSSGTWVLGAPEMVFPDLAGGHPVVAEKLVGLIALGLRTLILAHSDDSSAVPDVLAHRLPESLNPVMLVTFAEKIRPDAAQTIAYFREQGVSLKVISGDNPRTVAAIARRVGIPFEGSGYDARDLPVDPGEMGEILELNTVFGRVSPAQKREMVDALQRRGHVVAMTGDGVNDALALKAADIGIAMGTGAAATKAVARMVLLDGRFSRLPNVVDEGRRVIENIERVSRLFLTKTVYAVLLSITVGFLLWKFPFLPRQLAPTDGLTIGIPALFLALAVQQKPYTPGFLKRSLRFAVPAGLATTAAIVTVLAFARAAGGYPLREMSTAAAITLSVVGFWVLVVTARPSTTRRILMLMAMATVLAACFLVPVAREFLDFAVPTGALLAVTFGVAAIACVAVEVIFRSLPREPSHAEPKSADPNGADPTSGDSISGAPPRP
ncbi:HAD-IC family P-type ATPase [Lacisediminihabitans sp. FW035]